MINVAGQIPLEYQKNFNESQQTTKNFEKEIGDEKIKNDVLNKVLQINEKQPENDCV